MKKGLIIGGILFAAALAGGGWYYSEYGFNLPGGTSTEETVYVTDVASLMGTSQQVQIRYAGVVEAQDTVSVTLESGRVVKEVKVSVGEEVKKGQLLFEYDLTSLDNDLKQAQLDLDRLKNEAASYEQQIQTLEKEKAKAKQDAQLSYTIEIETNRMNLKKNEYDQISKEAEIERLQNASVNTEVRSEIDGIIQKIDTSKLSQDTGSSVSDTLEGDDSYDSTDSGSDNSFIKILSTGEYRVKGMVNELNINNIIPGQGVLIRSRMDENEVWKGTLGSIDRENASKNTNNYYYMSDDSMTNSSSYPFYVTLDTSEGLMLGQHVYIELDEGQETKKEGVWVSEFFIADLESESPYVWAADENGRLEKREITLGQYDQDLKQYEVVEGLSQEDLIAYPAKDITPGMKTVKGTGEQTLEARQKETMEEILGDQEDSDDPLSQQGQDAFDTSDMTVETGERTGNDAGQGVVIDDWEEPEVIEDDGFFVEEDLYPAEDDNH